MKEKIKNKKKIKLFIYVLLFLTLLPISYAIPVPHGIDGTIYELDGITPVGDNIDFSVNDITTGEFIQGKTKNNGYYSISLNGNNGDIIIITTWTKYNSNNRTVTLQGVMHNVDLLLNTSIPNLPPNITSTQPTEAYVSEWYIYHVNATDPDNDTLNYSLLKRPINMHINKNTGLLKWKPLKKHIGNHEIIIEVSDGSLSTTQIFNITVYQQSESGKGGGGGGSSITGLGLDKLLTENNINQTLVEIKEEIPEIIKNELIFEKPSSIIEKISIKGKIKEDLKLKVKEFPKRPDKIKCLDKKVYRYLEIRLEEEIEADDTIIQFKVEKKWIEENEAEIADLILNRYIDNNWEEIPTEHIDSKGDYIYYKARTDSFSYFAISLKFLKEPTKITITGPKQSHVISGIIFRNNRKKQVEKGTELRITNTNTGATVEIKTGFKQNPGGYYTIINGNDRDKINIEVKTGFTYKNTTIILKGDMRNVDLILTKGGLSAITGYAIAPLAPISEKGYAIAIAILLAICLGYLEYKRIKIKS